MSAAQLVRHKEDPDERGGYFIVNGNEKVIRLLVMPRANFVLPIMRSSFANRSAGDKEIAVVINFDTF